MLWGNAAYCAKLSGEDPLRCSNKIESVRENVRILLRKCCHDNKHLSELAPQHGEHRYGMKKLCHCHPMYSQKKHAYDIGRLWVTNQILADGEKRSFCDWTNR